MHPAPGRLRSDLNAAAARKSVNTKVFRSTMPIAFARTVGRLHCGRCRNINASRTRPITVRSERGGGPEVGEYQGLPINDADRLRADSWSASLWTVPEHQCIPHPADYGPI